MLKILILEITPFMFETIITPRVNETDGAGHINNTVVPIWFEAGRLEIFRILTPDLSFASWKAALVNINIDYVKQIYLGKDCLIQTWIDRIGTKSFAVGERVLQQGDICAKGVATYVYYNYNKAESEEIPLSVRNELKKHMTGEENRNLRE